LADRHFRQPKDPVNKGLSGAIRLADIFVTLRVKNFLKGNATPKLLSTKQAGEILGVDASRIRQMILRDQLPAQKMGRDWFVEEKDLSLVADRKLGRPPLTDEEKAESAERRTAQDTSGLPFEPPATTAKPKARKATKMTAKKQAASKK